jgi:hypothetical protein
VHHDHQAAVRLVNEQTEIAMLLSAPVFHSHDGNGALGYSSALYGLFRARS